MGAASIWTGELHPAQSAGKMSGLCWCGNRLTELTADPMPRSNGDCHGRAPPSHRLTSAASRHDSAVRRRTAFLHTTMQTVCATAIAVIGHIGECTAGLRRKCGHSGTDKTLSVTERRPIAPPTSRRFAPTDVREVRHRQKRAPGWDTLSRAGSVDRALDEALRNAKTWEGRHRTRKARKTYPGNVVMEIKTTDAEDSLSLQRFT